MAEMTLGGPRTQRDHYAAFAEIVREVAHNSDLDGLFERVTAILGQTISSSRAMIGLYPPNVKTYSFQSIWRHRSAPFFEQIIMPGRDENPSFQMLLRGQTYVCHDTATDPRFTANRKFYARYGIAATMFAGLWREGKWWGSVGVHQCGCARTWTDQERLLLELTADQVALAIDLIRYKERSHHQAAVLVDLDPPNYADVGETKHGKLESYGVTDGEGRVLRLLAKGETNAEIAAALNISRRTVETHITNMLAKLDLRNRVELARFALERGLR